MASRNSAGCGAKSANVTVIKNAYFEAMRDVSVRKVDKIPYGWFTCKQWAEKIGRCHKTMISNMNKLVAAGNAECRKFNVEQSKRVVGIKHYKLVT